MTSTKFCPACGQPNQLEARFCGHCGASMPVITKREKRPFPRLLVGVLAAFLLFALAFILVSQTSFFAADTDSQAHIDSSTPDSPAEVAAADVASINGEETAVFSVLPDPSPIPTVIVEPTLQPQTPTPSETAVSLPTATPSLTPILTNTPSPSPTPPSELLKPLTGVSLVQLTFDKASHYTPAFSPDQQHLILSAKIDDYWQLVEVDANGGGVGRQITRFSANFYQPQYSADAQSILVASDMDGDQDIYLLDAATGDVLQQLTNNPGNDYHPRWLSDQSAYVFSSNQDGNDEIYLGYLNGQQTRLTNNSAYDGFATVSADGRYITFYSSRDGDYEIYVMDINGRNPQRLTTSSGRDADPVFSPDGAWIAFESERSGNYDIYAMRLDGTDVRQLTDHASGDWFPVFSPDGLWLMFQSDRSGNMDIFRIPFLSRSLSLSDPRLVGEDVHLVQQKLLELGYAQVGEADGVFSPLTAQAVRAFQQAYGLEVDGIVGPITWSELFNK